MKYGYIYKTTNLTNGRIYIGQHKGYFDSNYLGSGNVLRRALKKHGWLNFKVEEIASAEDKKELDVLEIFYIKKYRKNHYLYNISDGGFGGKVYLVHPMLGKKHSEETKKKMSQNRSGDKNPNYKKPICQGADNPMFGKTHSQETRLKISQSRLGKKNPFLSKLRKGKAPWNKGLKGAQIAWNKGIPWSEEVKQHISMAKKGASY